jgi:copper homeostasis protein
MILEIAVFNSQSAIDAVEYGADRLELCQNISAGGTTPSYGFLKLIKQKIHIPVFVMIRPRSGNFLYSSTEFEIMKQDILLCKNLGYNGIVLGLLNTDGTVDSARTATLVNLAYPMEVTFHKAFDGVKNPMEALETIIQTGCTRILTSGQQTNAIDGQQLIKQLIQVAAERITIMPGGGVRNNNINALANFTKANEFHSAARKLEQSSLQVFNNSLLENLQTESVDEKEIKLMKEQLKMLQ